jgi:transcriptional regulator with XRE-family HTH domain
MKEQRRFLGISQAKLAERANTATHYIAMIELEKKFPTPDMLERIAVALEIDAPELFSTQPPPAKVLKNWQKTVLTDVERAIQETVKTVIAEHLGELDKISGS